ncbi:PTS sugar transporter subunit IIB [Anaerococcus urinomassiliensis]|uniref:PTS sugar transporter subunit IIB n=1 Tax=Anaerococcus urinomassiliensis TaxID=1745712 RepID=UPI00093FE650|nr:PTS sugar transporter subunit IIB [Anaerococcus urinomassiliensis]
MKVLAVCGFGVGSSMILKMSAEKALRNLNIEGDVENTDLSGARGTDVDLILTSNELANELKSSVNVPVIPIMKYMDVNEVESKIKEFIDKE